METLPPDNVPSGISSPVEPRKKAVIMCWMRFADLTAARQENTSIKSRIAFAAPRIARKLCLELFMIDVQAESIEIYYRQAKKNFEALEETWDKWAVAKILRSQVSDPKTYDIVSRVLDTYLLVSHSIPISFSPSYSFSFACSRPLMASSRLKIMAQKRQ